MSELSTEVMAVIPDHIKLKDCLFGPSPLLELIKGYNGFVLKHSSLKEIDPETATGKDLKDGIMRLDPDERLFLLSKYTRDYWSLCDPWIYESPKERDERALRHWVISFLVASIFCVITGIFGTVIAVGFFSGAWSNNAFDSSMMETAYGIVEIIINTNFQGK